MKFVPGQFVVCLWSREEWDTWVTAQKARPPPFPIKGTVYTVADYPLPWRWPDYMRLHELPPDVIYCEDGFGPVEESGMEVLRQALVGSPTRTREEEPV